VQAAIAAVHANAPSSDDTDWAEIAALYALLAEIAPSPVVELNRAAAVSMTDGPQAGLALADRLAGDEALASSHLLHAARADMLARLGRGDEAATAYRRAIELAANDAERRLLEHKLAAL
jgi:RNA polymerase sigma-70 factor (ECF subfamily)